MNLPKPDITIVEWNHRSFVLQFRKLALGEIKALLKMEKEGQEKYFDFVYELLATLLEGYDDTLEDRITFIKALEFDTIEECVLEINVLLELLGMPVKKKEVGTALTASQS